MGTVSKFEAAVWLILVCSFLGVTVASYVIVHHRFFTKVQNSSRFIVEGMSMGLMAAIIFGIGLLGGLTPSEGEPSLLGWFVWTVVPLGLALLSFSVVKPWAFKVLFILEAGGIVAFTVSLLRLFHIV